MLVGITTWGVGESSDAAGGAGASFSVGFGAVVRSRAGAFSSAFASSQALFFASRVPPAGGFGVTEGAPRRAGSEDTVVGDGRVERWRYQGREAARGCWNTPGRVANYLHEQVYELISSFQELPT
ncbi:hypothetical protein WMF31_11120 [Sorangium sp. So ce1036]|uniref:hypothetical protein n=1 Tax=Sorangium sp. So ce1036 TaxID=3133328 RepID=UPI003F102D28